MRRATARRVWRGRQRSLAVPPQTPSLPASDASATTSQLCPATPQQLPAAGPAAAPAPRTSVDGEALEQGVRLQRRQLRLWHVGQHHILFNSQPHAAVAVPARGRRGGAWEGKFSGVGPAAEGRLEGEGVREERGRGFGTPSRRASERSSSDSPSRPAHFSAASASAAKSAACRRPAGTQAPAQNRPSCFWAWMPSTSRRSHTSSYATCTCRQGQGTITRGPAAEAVSGRGRGCWQEDAGWPALRKGCLSHTPPAP